MRNPTEPQKSKTHSGKEQFKGSPEPTKGQAVESGEPTLTGSETDRSQSTAQKTPVPPKDKR